MQHWILMFLLVVVSFNDCAHGETYLINKDVVTSLLKQRDANQQSKNLLNLDKIVAVRTPSSAVQDWSLVCQQLCGAALGGAVCAPYCKNLPFLPYQVQLENAEDLLEARKNYICPEICALQLGDGVCTCKNYNTGNIKSYLKKEGKTNICAILCDHNNVTLTGCTPCQKGKNDEYVIFHSVNTFNDDPIVTTPTTTTPDWNQLCASLCKTGDGGSLCNCDLSPFFV